MKFERAPHARVARCDYCRHWSELMAKSSSGGDVLAMCLESSSPFSGKYRRGEGHCSSFAEAHGYSTDDPDLPAGFHDREDARRAGRMKGVRA